MTLHLESATRGVGLCGEPATLHPPGSRSGCQVCDAIADGRAVSWEDFWVGVYMRRVLGQPEPTDPEAMPPGDWRPTAIEHAQRRYVAAGWGGRTLDPPRAEPAFHLMVLGGALPTDEEIVAAGGTPPTPDERLQIERQVAWLVAGFEARGAV